tara:strand:+ start:8222 stop:9100 length:879 start_codon:yes stop_codon:yes gene_type:complete
MNARTEQKAMNIFELLGIIKDNIRVIIYTVAAGILFGLYLSFSSPNVYRAQVLMVEAEQIGGSGSGGASGLINSILGNSGLSPMFGGFSSSTTSKIAVLESRKFTESFVEQYNLLPQLFPQKWDEDTDTWKESKPSLWDAYFLISKKIRSVDHDIRKGLITLTIDTNDPKLSMEIANSMVSAINDYIRKESIVETNETIDYLQVELSKTDIVDIKRSLNSLLEDQLKTVMVASTKEEFAFKVIDPAYAPNKKVAPYRALIMVVSTALAGILSIIIIFVSIMIKNQKSQFLND